MQSPDEAKKSATVCAIKTPSWTPFSLSARTARVVRMLRISGSPFETKPPRKLWMIRVLQDKHRGKLSSLKCGGELQVSDQLQTTINDDNLQMIRNDQNLSPADKPLEIVRNDSDKSHTHTQTIIDSPGRSADSSPIHETQKQMLIMWMPWINMRNCVYQGERERRIELNRKPEFTDDVHWAALSRTERPIGLWVCFASLSMQQLIKLKGFLDHRVCVFIARSSIRFWSNAQSASGGPRFRFAFLLFSKFGKFINRFSRVNRQETRFEFCRQSEDRKPPLDVQLKNWEFVETVLRNSLSRQRRTWRTWRTNLKIACLAERLTEWYIQINSVSYTFP